MMRAIHLSIYWQRSFLSFRPSSVFLHLLLFLLLLDSIAFAFHSIHDQVKISSSLLRRDAVVSISDSYDGGNIELVRQENSKQWKQDEDPTTTTTLIPHRVILNIKSDPYTEFEDKHHYQYFSFRSTPNLSSSSSSEDPLIVEYVIDNAGDSSYAEAWNETTIFYSTSINDPNSWKRNIHTSYNPENGKLSWTHNHSDSCDSPSPSVFFCYFPPYSYSRHLDLIDKCNKIRLSSSNSIIVAGNLKVYSLGQTCNGAELDCIQVGTGKTICWIIHRQHPGEHMAEYYAEGLLTRLLGLQTNGDVDGLVRKILSLYTFYIVPSMNPDGGTLGHLRTNARGANLNREWCSSMSGTPTGGGGGGYEAPTIERSPEVYYVLEKMKQTGCDVFLDIHGDEGLPYCFLAQPCVPNWGRRLETLHGMFLASYCRTNPDMQQQYGYEPRDFEQDGDGILNIACSQIAYRFDCLSATLEMPFKDCWSNPDPKRGWSPARAASLGGSVLEPLVYVHPFLRDTTEFWNNNIPKEDEYIRPTSNYK